MTVAARCPVKGWPTKNRISRTAQAFRTACEHSALSVRRITASRASSTGTGRARRPAAGDGPRPCPTRTRAVRGSPVAPRVADSGQSPSRCLSGVGLLLVRRAAAHVLPMSETQHFGSRPSAHTRRRVAARAAAMRGSASPVSAVCVAAPWESRPRVPRDRVDAAHRDIAARGGPVGHRDHHGGEHLAPVRVAVSLIRACPGLGQGPVKPVRSALSLKTLAPTGATIRSAPGRICPRETAVV